MHVYIMHYYIIFVNYNVRKNVLQNRIYIFKTTIFSSFILSKTLEMKHLQSLKIHFTRTKNHYLQHRLILKSFYLNFYKKFAELSCFDNLESLPDADRYGVAQRKFLLFDICLIVEDIVKFI